MSSNDVRVYDNVVEVELTCDTAAHAANDVVWQPTELPLAALPNGCAVVMSVELGDYDDQGVALDLVFLNQPTTVGANNAAMTIPDTQLDHVLGHLSIAAGDYLNLATNQVATLTNCGLELRPLPATPQSVWIAGRTPGTPTYATGRLNLKVGFLRG